MKKQSAFNCLKAIIVTTALLIMASLTVMATPAGSSLHSLDQVLTKLLESGAISQSEADIFCAIIATDQWMDMGSHKSANASALKNERCENRKIEFTTEFVQTMKDNYETWKNERVNLRYHRYFPETDELFDEKIKTVSFYDNKRQIVKIPTNVILAAMYLTSKGSGDYKNDARGGHGLFGIAHSVRIVKTSHDDGIIEGIHAPGQDYDTNIKYPDVLSLYNPNNNLLKFGQIIQGIYYILQSEVPEFENLTADEKWRYVIFSYFSGVDILIR